MKFEVNSDTGFVTVGYGAGSSPTFTRVLVGNGTAAAPSYSFTNDSNTGFYIVPAAPDILYFTAAGTNALRFSGVSGNGYVYSGASNANIGLLAAGGISLSADGTNQNITLTPSGHATSGGLTLSRLTSTAQTLALLNFGSDELMHIVGVGYAGSGSRTNVPYILYSNNVERCRITATGNLLIATTADNTLGKLQIFGSLTTAESFGTGLFGYFGGADLVVGTLNATQVVFRTNNIAAITIDTSQNVTFSKNLFLGTNGPAVASTLNARASRQGLVFNGTRGVSVAGTPFNFGTGNFTIAFRVRRDSAATQQYLIGNDIFSCFYAGFRVGGNLFSGLVGGSPNADLNLANEVGKEQHIVLTRSGTTLTCYANGVSVGTTTDSNNYSGSAFTVFAADSGGSAALVGMGIVEGVYNRALSAAEVVSLYQSGTPSQADRGVVGSVPPSNTALTGDTFTNFQYDTFTGASTTGFTAVETGGQGCQANTTKSASGTFLGIAAAGTRYLVTFTATLTSGAIPAVALGKVNVGTASANVVVTNGANAHILTSTLAFTAEFGADSGTVFFATVGNTSYAISGFNVKRLGTVLAPDANQQGGGLTWYDTSGNNCTITLPATGVTGVSWNVVTGGQITLRDGTAAAPAMSFANQADMGFYKISSAVLGLAVSGAVQLRFDPTGSIYGGGAGINNIVQLAATGAINLIAAGTNQNISLSPSGNGWVAVPNNNNLQLGLTFGQAVSNASNYFNSGNGAGWVMHFTTGSASYNSSNVRLTITDSNLWTPSNINLLLGTNVDSSNGRLQLAAHTAATGGIGFGTEISLYRAASTQLTVTVSTIEVASFIRNGSGTAFQVNGGSLTQPTIHVNGDSNTGLFFELGDTLSVVTGGTRAISFDGSQNATFTGTAITAASATGKAGLRLPHGAAPTAPVNGDIWTTTAGLYVRINGATVGPLT